MTESTLIKKTRVEQERALQYVWMFKTHKEIHCSEKNSLENRQKKEGQGGK